VTRLSADTAVIFCGIPGGTPAVAVTADEGVPKTPALLTARTLKSYVSPLFRPVNRWLLVPSVSLALVQLDGQEPPASRRCTSKCAIVTPDIAVGLLHVRVTRLFPGAAATFNGTPGALPASGVAVLDAAVPMI
jgi:hypothetical protein